MDPMPPPDSDLGTWQKTKVVHIHLGPHRTGSSSIQAFIRENQKSLTVRGLKPLYDKNFTSAAKLCARQDNEAAAFLLRRVSERLANTAFSEFILSAEDFCGQLPGRQGRRLIYPHLLKNLRLIEENFAPHDCRFYFFLREPDDWIRSVYNQFAKHSRLFVGIDSFKEKIEVKNLWESTLKNSRAHYGAKFREIVFLESGEFNSLKALLDAIKGFSDDEVRLDDTPRLNLSLDPENLLFLEKLNKSSGSDFAVDAARKDLLLPRKPNHKPRAANEVLPEESIASLEGLSTRASERFTYQDVPWLLPLLEFPLGKMWQQYIPDEEVSFPDTTRLSMEGQSRILRFRMRGLPEPCFLMGMSISYLRRNTEHTESAANVFFNLWTHEHANLLAFLPTRWLISSLQTFLDHGRSENDRLIGSTGYFLANIMKAYEAERGLEGLNADDVYPYTSPRGRNGGFGLDRFDLGRTDLLLNTLSLAYEISLKDVISGRVLREFLRRVKSGHSIFSRMDRSRLHHGIEPAGFLNCWSFFERPNETQKV